MKLKMYFLLLALGALGLQSCDNDDDLSYVPAELKNEMCIRDRYTYCTLF